MEITAKDIKLLEAFKALRTADSDFFVDHLVEHVYEDDGFNPDGLELYPNANKERVLKAVEALVIYLR
jgi:hypothetical protein